MPSIDTDGRETGLENNRVGQSLRAGWFDGYRPGLDEVALMSAGFDADAWERA